MKVTMKNSWIFRKFEEARRNNPAAYPKPIGESIPTAAAKSLQTLAVNLADKAYEVPEIEETLHMAYAMHFKLK